MAGKPLAMTERQFNLLLFIHNRGENYKFQNPTELTAEYSSMESIYDDYKFLEEKMYIHKIRRDHYALTEFGEQILKKEKSKRKRSAEIEELDYKKLRFEVRKMNAVFWTSVISAFVAAASLIISLLSLQNH